MHSLNPAEILILIAVTAGAITDVITKKIYNIITFPAMALGLIINIWLGYGAGGVNGALAAAGWAIFACFLGMIITMGPTILKRDYEALHPGDAKMWGAIGACLLPAKMIIAWFYFSLAYGLVAMFMVLKSIPRDQVKGFWLRWNTWFTSGIDLSNTVDTTEFDKARKALIPICPAIAIGTYLGVFCDKPLLYFLGIHLN